MVYSTMHLIAVGLSHRTAPVELREKAALTDAAARSVMRALLADPRNSEALAISTCNRTELYLRSPRQHDRHPALRVRLRALHLS